jgi:hypothetical protein
VSLTHIAERGGRGNAGQTEGPDTATTFLGSEGRSPDEGSSLIIALSGVDGSEPYESESREGWALKFRHMGSDETQIGCRRILANISRWNRAPVCGQWHCGRGSNWRVGVHGHE